LVKEWRADTWEFGSTFEVKIDRMATCKQFGEYIKNHLFPHIDVDFLFATRVDILKPFIRSDLALKKW